MSHDIYSSNDWLKKPGSRTKIPCAKMAYFKSHTGIEIHGNTNLLIYGHIYHLYLFIECNVIMIHLKYRAHLICKRRDSDGYVWISMQTTLVEIRRAQQVKIMRKKYTRQKYHGTTFFFFFEIYAI